MSDTMHVAAELVWERENGRAQQILANFAASVNHAVTREDQLRAVVGIAGEVERHANAIDPREVTAVSVLVELVVDLAGGMRHLANVMIRDDRPKTGPRDYPVELPEWPASLMDPEVQP